MDSLDNSQDLNNFEDTDQVVDEPTDVIDSGDDQYRKLYEETKAELNQLKDQMFSLMQVVQGLSQQKPVPTPQDEPEINPEDLLNPNIDWDNASVRDYHNFMLSKLVPSLELMLDKKLKNLNDKLDKVQVDTIQRDYQHQIEDCMRTIPDFMHYKNQILELAQKHPTMQVRDLYVLAKGLTLGLHKPRQVSPNSVVAKPKSPKPGTASPNPGDLDKSKKPGFDAAFERAYQKVFGDKKEQE